MEGVEGPVDLDGVEMARGEMEFIFLGEVFGVEGASPGFVAPAGDADAELHKSHKVNRGPVGGSVDQVESSPVGRKTILAGKSSAPLGLNNFSRSCVQGFPAVTPGYYRWASLGQHLEPPRLGRGVACGDDGVESAAGGPFGGDGHGAGMEDGDEIIEDAIGDGLIKDALVAEGLEVELVGFKFDAELVGDVGELDGAEVGLAGDGADGGEFRRDVEDGVVARDADWGRLRGGRWGVA